MLHDSVRCGTVPPPGWNRSTARTWRASVRGLDTGKSETFTPKAPPSESRWGLRNLLAVPLQRTCALILIMICRTAWTSCARYSGENDEARRQVANEAAYLATLPSPISWGCVQAEVGTGRPFAGSTRRRKSTTTPGKENRTETKASRDKYIAAFYRSVQKKPGRGGTALPQSRGAPNPSTPSTRRWKEADVRGGAVYDPVAIASLGLPSGKREKLECWQAYSIVTDMYQPSPVSVLRDWLSVPASNGYEIAAHHRHLGPEGKWVEVQTHRTHAGRDSRDGGLPPTRRQG